MNIKVYATCCRSGYCYVGLVDGGFSGNIETRQWAKCPLGRTTRHVLYTLLKACPEFAVQIDGAGIHIAIDNYFTSVTLLLCLASHDIFAVGTLRKNRTGVPSAIEFWEKDDKTFNERCEYGLCEEERASSGSVGGLDGCVYWLYNQHL